MKPRTAWLFVLAALGLRVCAIAGEHDQQAADLLKRLESATEAEERMEIMLKLGQIGPEAREAIPVLVKLLGSQARLGPGFLSDGLEGDRAKWALSNIGSEAVPALLPALKHADPFVRFQAVEALIYMFEDARDAVPHLVELAKTRQSP